MLKLKFNNSINSEKDMLFKNKLYYQIENQSYLQYEINLLDIAFTQVELDDISIAYVIRISLGLKSQILWILFTCVNSFTKLLLTNKKIITHFLKKYLNIFLIPNFHTKFQKLLRKNNNLTKFQNLLILTL